MSPMDEILHETLRLRTAFGDLVAYVCPHGCDASTVPLRQVIDGLHEMGVDRYAGLLYAHRLADSAEDARALATEVRDWLLAGRRPRTMQQVLAEPELAAVERAFTRHMTAAQPWWRRLGVRIARAVVADLETSRRLDEADRRQRFREGKMP
jgi:hypothetical protein